MPARELVWALLLGFVLRQSSFRGVEALVGLGRLSALGMRRRFGDDTLAYFTERLDVDVTRAAAATALRRAKRNKAFDACLLIGLAVDGTGAGHTSVARCGGGRTQPPGLQVA